jgi:DNA-binding FadR family transcriptional regulator
MRKVPTDPDETRGGKPGAKKAAVPRRKPAEPAPQSAASKQRSNLQALAQARKHAESGTAKVVASLIDPFGFRKFEDVFDQRVACALDRLGMPAADVLISLIKEVEALRRRVEQLEKARR